VSDISSVRASPVASFRRTSAVWRYWFRPGGELSLGIVRIAIFAAVFHTLLLNFSSPNDVSPFLATMDSANYLPKGILKLFGPAALSPTVMVGVWWLAYGGAILALIGLFTGPAMVIGVLATLALVSLRESFGPFWSHGYNVIMLAGLAFMFGPAGSSLSMDRIIRRLVPRWPFGRDLHPTSYYWPVLAAQIAVALFYFGAFWAKLYNGGLAWVFSDNMRIMLAITWEHPYYAVPIPWYIQALLDHQLLWQLAAFVHLTSQALPLFAAFLIHRPFARLTEGIIYAAGVYGLYRIMNVWDPQWFWLVAVFVDWEWVLANARSALYAGFPRLASHLDSAGRRGGVLLLPSSFVPGAHGGTPPPSPTTPASATARRLRIAILGYVGAFLGYYVLVFGFQLGAAHLNYPFSSFSFYAVNYAYPPYHAHRHYTFWVGGIRFRGVDCQDLERFKDARGPVFICDKGTAEFDRRVGQLSTIFEYYRLETPAAISGALRSIRSYVDAHYPGAIPPSATTELLSRLWQYPPYPKPVTPHVTLEGLRGAMLGDGRTVSATATRQVRSEGVTLTLSLDGFIHPELELASTHNSWYDYGNKPPRSLPGRWTSDRTFEIDMKALQRPAFVSIIVREGGTTRAFWGPIVY
jgi:hypothetical protein